MFRSKLARPIKRASLLDLKQEISWGGSLFLEPEFRVLFIGKTELPRVGRDVYFELRQRCQLRLSLDHRAWGSLHNCS